MPKPPTLEDLIDLLRDAALDYVEDHITGSMGRLKDRVRQMETGETQQPVQGRRRRVQEASNGPSTTSTWKPKSKAASPSRKPTRTAYTVLGVMPDAEQEVLSAAYRAKCKLCHPDKPENNGKGDKMAEINAAWEILKDPAKRKQYDRSLGL